MAAFATATSPLVGAGIPVKAAKPGGVAHFTDCAFSVGFRNTFIAGTAIRTACAVAVPAADQAGVFQLPPLDPPDHPCALAGTHFAVIGTGNPVALPVESIAVNQPQLGRLRPLADQTGLSAPPPAILRLPII